MDGRKVSHTHISIKVGISCNSKYDNAVLFDTSKLVNSFSDTSITFNNGLLLPNTELGLLQIKGIAIEEQASNKVRKEEGIKRKTWAKRLQATLEHYERVFHPDLFIMGGQVSKKPEKTFPFIKINTKLKPATLKNEASIVGAAYYASLKQKLK